ncbi:MAG: NPCBM/NEW2 domain-containing protein [Pirellulales bacterium]
MFATRPQRKNRTQWSAYVRISLLLAIAAIASDCARAEEVLLSSLEIGKAKFNNEAAPAADKSAGGGAITINGQAFERGVSMNGYTVLFLNLAGGSDRFSATVGIDDDSAPPLDANRGDQPQPTGRGRRGRGQQGPTPVVFRVLGDGRVLRESPAIRVGEEGVEISADVKGVQTLVLVAAPAGGRGGGGRRGGPALHANWANAKFDVSGPRPIAIDFPSEEPYILTPKPGPEPRINGPVLTGVTPGHPVLYKIPVTGTKPIAYSVTNLPAGLTLDPETGIITGVIPQRGTYTVTFNAKNAVGSASKEFKFVAEGKLSLTPALGWNSWNVYRAAISDELARATADAFVTTGLIDHGWTYINLDDGWENRPGGNRRGGRGGQVFAGPTRNEDGSINPNVKFPDMKALGDYIHSKGLKFGIYTGPGPTTCQGLEASWQHELQDFTTFANWGVDYIKYDWCGYNSVLAEGETTQQLPVLKRPYQVGRQALNQIPRDIIYSLCQYGWGRVWEWGAEPGIEGHSWRTTGDIQDNWQSMSSIGFQQVDLAQHAGPGHWNDPDMLVIGVVTGGPSGTRPTNLTPNEQYTHITLWTLYSSPLLLGNDMTKIDEFTLSLCNNDEVLAVHQDPLGKTASRVAQQGNLEVWSRPLADGSRAVGLFNRDEMTMKVTAKWSDIGISGRQTVRDLWRQLDLGVAEGEFTVDVPRHGAVLLKISPAAARTQP